MARDNMTSRTPKIVVGGIAVGPAQVSRGKVDKVVSELRGLIQTTQRDLNIHVDDVTGHAVIRVVEASTNRMVRQIPEEDVLSLAMRLNDMQKDIPKGILIQSEA